MSGNVVIVPGFAGSRLEIQTTGGVRYKLFPEPDAILRFGPDAIRLGTDGINPYLSGFRVAEALPGRGGPFPYQPLLDRLTAQGWSAYLYYYDWRRSILQTSVDLATWLRDRFHDDTFQVICHSMGGLLARLAYVEWQRQGGTTGWQRTVFVATPHDGSTEAGYCLAFNLDAFADLLCPAHLILYRILLRVFGPLAAFHSKATEIMRRLVASWPSVYELLPSQLPPYRLQAPWNAILWQSTAYAQTNPNVQLQWFQRAQATRDALTACLNQHPLLRQVIGVGLDTKSRLKENTTALAAAAEYDSTNAGDGVVESQRANYPDVPSTLTLLNVEHQATIQDTRFLALANAMLGDLPFDPVTVPPPPQLFAQVQLGIGPRVPPPPLETIQGMGVVQGPVRQKAVLQPRPPRPTNAVPTR